MFVRATYYREKKTVHYFDENGDETLYIGGSFAWRTNNPGNMAKPGKRVVSTSIGYAQRTSNPKSLFLIFPTARPAMPSAFACSRRSTATTRSHR